MTETLSFDEDTARQRLARLIESRASGEDILACLLPLEQKAEMQPPTIASGEIPPAEFWRERRYTERRAFDTLLDDLEKSAAGHALHGLRSEHRAVLIIGPPAAGKSAIAGPVAQALGGAIVDPDDAKTQIPEYDGGKGAWTVHHEAGLLSIYVLARFLKCGANVILPKVGGSCPMTERLVQILVDAGYAVAVIHVSVSFDETVRRMAHRFLESGRIVQADYIREVGTKTRNTFAHLKQKGIAHGAIEIDAEDIARRRIAGTEGGIWPELRAALEQT